MFNEKIWISKKGFDLFPAAGDPLPVSAVELVARRPNDTDDIASIAELRLICRVPTALYYARIEPEALFGLKSVARGPVFGGRFDDEPALEITARLRADLLDEAKAGAEMLYDVAGKALMKSSVLRRTDAWLALTVLQPRDGVKVGMTTTYAD